MWWLRKILNGYRKLCDNTMQYFKKLFLLLFSPNIEFDKHTYIGEKVKLVALKGAKIDIRGVHIKRNSYLYADFNANIYIGRGTQIGMYNIIVSHQEILIGGNTQIAEFVTIRDQDHQFGDLNKFNTATINIGNDVWIANKVTITKGVSIGNNSVVGANSVVTKNIDANFLAVGIPAKSIRKI